MRARRQLFSCTFGERRSFLPDDSGDRIVILASGESTRLPGRWSGSSGLIDEFNELSVRDLELIDKKVINIANVLNLATTDTHHSRRNTPLLIEHSLDVAGNEKILP